MQSPKRNTSNNVETANKGFMLKFLDRVEVLGNKLPHPFMLFVYLALGIIVLSAVISLFDVTVDHPGTGETVAIKSLLSGEGLKYILTSMLTNFTEFKPLGLVLGMMLGIGLAQKVGLIQTFMKKTIINAPPKLVTYAIVLTGILGNLASDAAFIIVPPIAAMVFLTLGRHPIAGLAAGFAGVGAGFTANFLITGTDALLSGISTEVSKNIGEGITVTPVDNYFFMVFSVVMLMTVGTWVTEKIVEPKLGKYEGSADEKELEEIKPIESRGLRNAGIVALVYLGLLALAIFLPGSALRNEDGGLIPSPFLDGIVPIILFFFIALSVAYGITVKKIKTTNDVPKFMGESMKDMSGFIILIFAAAQFIAYFDWTNIGVWIAVSGAEFLQNINMTGLPVIIGFILLTAVLNLLIFSGSAQWALMAPVFIPMFALLDYNPAFTQMAYRIADSSTNIITPLNPYVPMILAFMKEYDKKAGFGTLFSVMLPYTVVFLTIWTILFVIWNLLGLPIGPGIHMKL